MTQGERFDPDGAYVRRFVPELAEVPTTFIHHPWNLPPSRFRPDYPEPIVDHQQARRRALAFFATGPSRT